MTWTNHAHRPPHNSQMRFRGIRMHPVGDSVLLISAPKGHKHSKPILKVCKARGMPMMVIAYAKLPVKYPKAASRPPKTHHSKFPIILIVPKLKLLFLKGKDITFYRHNSKYCQLFLSQDSGYTKKKSASLPMRNYSPTVRRTICFTPMKAKSNFIPIAFRTSTIKVATTISKANTKRIVKYSELRNCLPLSLTEIHKMPIPNKGVAKWKKVAST